MSSWEEFQRRQPHLQRMQELLQKGQGALAGGWLKEAEEFFAEASAAEAKASGHARTSSAFLGKVYAKQGRADDAVRMFEDAMPLPAAFTSLISLFRARGKAAKKAGDLQAARSWFNRLLSVSYVMAAMAEIRQGFTTWDEFEAAAMKWLDEVRRQNGTIYRWDYARDGAVPNDAVMSNTDYKTLHALTFETP